MAVSKQVRRVLVTGAAGFVGRHTVSYLQERGFEVHAVSRRTPPALEGVIWYQGDLFDAVFVRETLEQAKPSHLLHIAWFVEHGKFWNAAENLRCVESGLDLIRSFVERGGKRVVVAGTCFEYDIRSGWLSEELTSTEPSSLYGIAKDSLRRLVEAYANTVELSWAWGRVFFPFGPHEGNNRLVPSVIDSLIRGVPTRCSAGTQIRDFLHVEDVAGGLVALLDSTAEGAVNICSGEPNSIRSVVEQLAQLAGHPDLAQFGDLPIGNQPPFMVGDCRRLHKEVGFTPRYSTNEALRQTLSWWRSNP